MGNDGGSIPGRRDLVRESAKEQSTAQVFQSKQLNNSELWTSCSLCGQLLQEPVVSDWKGRLYNKEAILEYLIDPQSFGEAGAAKVVHVKTLKDLVELHRSFDKSGRWICPVSNKDIVNEGVAKKFVYLASCGHVFAESAIRELNSDTLSCPTCDTPYDEDLHVVMLNAASAEDLAAAEARLTKLRDQGLSHSLKKLKSKHKKDKKRPKDELEKADEPAAKSRKVTAEVTAS